MAASSTPWPFLAVLLSPARRTADGDLEAPRTYGLGCAFGAEVVTLPHVAERAEIVALAGEQWGFRTVGTQPDVALVAVERSTSPSPSLADPGEGRACTVAIVGDHDDQVRLVPGRTGPVRGAEGFTIDLGERLAEDHTAAGSPVVDDHGAVIGIVGPTATSGSVDAFGPEAIERALRESAAPAPASDALRERPDVFLNYAVASRADVRAALDLAAALRERGLRPWIADEHLRPDVSLAEEVVWNAIEEAGAFVACLGAERLGARGRDELDRAAARAQREPGFRVAAALLPGSRPGAVDALPSAFRSVAAFNLRDGLQDVGDLVAFLSPAPPSPAAFDLAGGVSSDLVDPTKGIDAARDHLRVGDYVGMFATVIADRHTPMPLSIGLFGEWGSGKSYFMGLLRGEIARLAGSGDEQYCGEIVQIGFNAWHYADSNLWASLGDEIFEQLAGPGESPVARRARLREELAGRLQRRKELEAATDRARDETIRLRGALEQATADRAHSASVLAKAVSKEAWSQLGVQDEAEQGRLLADELRGTREDAHVVRHALSGRRGALLAAGLVVAVVALVAGLVAAQGWLTTGGAALLVAVAGSAGWVISRVRSGLGVVRRVAGNLREETDSAVAREVADLRRAEAEEVVLRAQLDEVVGQVGELGRELAQLSPGQRLYRFVAERAESDAYRRQLGLISTIRKDFEQLIELMDDWRAQPDAAREDGRQPIDRIVLYIDDLDRCSSQQVVDVLQAVHLLLALDLFVVVVGVDPRWLLRSLRRQYRTMLTTGTPAAGRDTWWETTPQDYLEKIFNIPFALPRMSPDSFGDLIRSLAATESLAAPAPGGEDGDGAGDRVGGSPAGGAPAASADPAPLPVEDASEVAAIRTGEPKPPPRPLTPDELELLTALAPLVQTPRETKRLLNLYRMIRATRNLSPASSFLGDDAHPGEHQAVTILLGVLSARPELYEALLSGLAERPPDESWARVVAAMIPHQAVTGDWANGVAGPLSEAGAEAWSGLAAGLSDATARVTLPGLEPFQRWAPRIARFSFRLAAPARDGEAIA